MVESGGRTRPLHGRVKTLFRDDGYGFIQSEDGRDIYFHENSVLDNAWDKLETGSEVRFSEEMGIKGPQATSLHSVGKQGHRFMRRS